MISSLTSHLKLPDIVVLTLFLTALLFIAFMLYDCHRSGLRHPPPPPCRGLEKRALNSLPKLIFTSASASDHKLEECAICLSRFEEGEEIRVLPQCGHSYHVVCIDTWLASHSTCPSCRQNLLVSVSDTCRNCGQSSSHLPAEVSIEV